MTKNKKSEIKLQDDILRYLDTLHPEVWRIKVVTSNRRGVPDIIVCYRGKFIGLKVKRAEARLPAHQIFQGQLINKAGGEWCRVESVEDVKNVLKRMDW
jgi:hypothetical protein